MTECANIHVPDLESYSVKYYINNNDNVQPPRIWPLHLHDRMEMYILLEGDVSFMVESSLYKLSAGDAIVTSPNERHHCILNSHSVHRHLCFWFDSSCRTLLADFIERTPGSGNLISPDADAKRRLQEIYLALESAKETCDTHMQLYLTLEMLYIFRKSITSDDHVQQFPELLRKILADIDESFRTVQSLEYFTEKYFISTSTLNRLFKTYLLTTPKKYIEAKRLAYSRHLLKNGSTVLSACMESGFSDCSNYIRMFRKRFSITPGQYREGASAMDGETSYEC
ncbi:MAG: helix-turn-helix domain-containing protein [Clostridia bacterium]|nr:helix-turn-helix domain-containing protein [Clostridia bacterium]